MKILPIAVGFLLATLSAAPPAMATPPDTSQKAPLPGLSPEVQQQLAELARQSDALPRPTDLKAGTLNAIKDDDLSFAIAWYVDHRTEETHAPREAVLQKQTQATQDVYLSILLENEVLNGGFNQYFWNVSPVLVSRTAAALQRLGATDTLQVFNGALAQGEREAASRNGFKAQRTLQAFSDSYKHSQLEPFDQRFYALASELSARRTAFVRAHPGAFTAP